MLFRSKQDSKPICVLGDFNQRIPRERQPEIVYEALIRTFQKGFSIATRNTRDPADKLLIDHLAVNNQLNVSIHGFLPKTTRDGMKLTDHTGVVATLDVIAPH